MTKRLLSPRVWLFWAALLLVGCGKKHEARSPEDVAATENAGRVEPATEGERSILKSLDTLPADAPRTIGKHAVTAGAPYFAASGTRCREVTWDKERRLACREEAGWYFVPSVFGTTQN